MDLTVRDVAKLLRVSENTVYRLVRSGVLPAYRVHDHYRFNRVDLQEWAASQKRSVSPELFASNGFSGETLSLCDALNRGGIFYKIPGPNRDEVLDAVTRLAGIPSSVDRVLLTQLLAARETLGSTAIGDGIAIPHPRDPLVVQVAAPVILLCFLEHAVEFHATDGQAVHVLFTLLSPSVRSHLELLSKLAFSLHDEAFKGLLCQAAAQEMIFERLRALEETNFNPSPLKNGSNDGDQ